MNMSREKSSRLERIARMYYLDGLSQQKIAQLEGVSRPLISRLLQEAKSAGIVEIRISTRDERESLLARARRVFDLEGGVLVERDAAGCGGDRRLAREAIGLVQQLAVRQVGLDWGVIVGEAVELLEHSALPHTTVTDICPLIGDSGIRIPNYHSNDNIRRITHGSHIVPHYLHAPAFAESRSELELIRKSDHYLAMLHLWESLDLVMLHISPHPSTPDLASVARFGENLERKHAVGRFVAYYYNRMGELIHSDIDYTLQIPLSVLSRCRYVVGVCPASSGHLALSGALRTGILTHIVAPEQLMEAAVGRLSPLS